MHFFSSCWTFQILIIFIFKLEPDIDLFFKNFLKVKEIRNLWVEHDGVITFYEIPTSLQNISQLVMKIIIINWTLSKSSSSV